MTPRDTWRLAGYFGAMFAVVGLIVPYWPVYLQHRGLSAAEIGLVLSVGLWIKVVANPLVAQWADRRGLRRQPMVALALIVLAGYLLLPLVEGFALLLTLSVLCAVAFSAIMPLGESTVLAATYARGLDYGRLRLWGSLTFIATSWAGGWYLAELGASAVVWGIAVLVSFAVLACALLPVPERAAEASEGRAPLLRLAGMPVFLLFMATVSCLQASHAMLYGFATLYWREAGISDGMIGFLWAEGVLAEIVLFIAGAWLLRRVGVAGLLMLGAAAGMLRWTAYALSDELWLLLAMQMLHAFTFGATHLGAMHFIARAVPPAWSASAQSLYTAVSGGLAMGLATAVAGPLYAAVGGQAFLLGSVLATLGLVLALLLARRWTGGLLTASTEEVKV